jgi:Stress responsive A/B Barrel Domain
MRWYLAAIVALAGLALVVLLRNPAAAEANKAAASPMLSHDVYFTLKEKTPEARKKLVDACKKYLTNHPGSVFFAAGVLAEDLNRPVNDRDFDVALHIVFKDKESHDKYQDADRHKQFIEENKDGWAKVRVFDSVVETQGEK